jgi:hypothetical protein
MGKEIYMRQVNQLLRAMAIGLLFTVTSNAETKSDPSELTKLRREYQDKAQSEIKPVNDRYLVLLERMEKSFSRSTETHNAMAVREEIERLEKDPAYLVSAEEKSSEDKCTLAIERLSAHKFMHKKQWIYTFNADMTFQVDEERFGTYEILDNGTKIVLTWKSNNNRKEYGTINEQFEINLSESPLLPIK